MGNKTLRLLSTATIFFLLSFAGYAQENGEPGLISADQTGLPATLWLDESTSKMARIMEKTKSAELPLSNEIMMSLNLSTSSPALEKSNSERLGAARLKYLWQNGALDAAEALARLYDWSSPLVRKEVETIALLSTRPESYCDALIKGEWEEIQNGFKIYCHARNDQWDRAIEDYEKIQDRLSFERAALLERFLDLDQEQDPLRDQPWIDLPDPFTFVLDEAIGRPRGLKHLPPAYSYFSRESGVTPRSDLEISEELVHLGALPPPVLFAAYRANQAAESGGAWGRAQVVQWLDKLSKKSAEAQIFRVISTGEERFGSAYLEPLFAEEAGEKLLIYNPEDFSNPELQQAFIRLAVLGGWSQPQWRKLIDRTNPDLMLAFLLSHPEIKVNANQIFTSTPLARILKPAFLEGDIKPLEALAFGEAIWQSLYVIDDYERHPEFQVSAAFQGLILSGLDSEARLIACALLLRKPKR